MSNPSTARSPQTERVPCRPRRRGPAIGAAARLAGVLVDLGAGMQRLAGRFELIAPDLRGFGGSEKPDPGPSDRAGAGTHAADMLALLEALGLERVGMVGHESVAAWSRSWRASGRNGLRGIFLFDTPHPGIGARWPMPEHLKEIWYQSFHQLPWRPSLVGASRESCRPISAHFLRHWSARQGSLRRRAEAWVDNFMQPGQSAGRLQLVHQRQRGAARRDARRGAGAAADRGSDLRALGGRRSRACRVGRPAGRDVFRT